MFNKKTIIGNVGTYKIYTTNHSTQRIKDRNIDVLKLVGCILCFGTEKLKEYEDTKKDILIKDIVNNFSVIFAVYPKHITVITVIDKADCFIKDGSNTVVYEI